MVLHQGLSSDMGLLQIAFSFPKHFFLSLEFVCELFVLGNRILKVHGNIPEIGVRLDALLFQLVCFVLQLFPFLLQVA